MGDEVHWEDRLCRDDPDAWFPEKRDRATLAPIIATCMRCPVLDQCREYAKQHPDDHGVWAGERRSDANAHAKYRSIDVVLQPCGTEAAYRRHLYNDEEPCAPCRIANSEAKAAKRKRIRERAVA